MQIEKILGIFQVIIKTTDLYQQLFQLYIFIQTVTNNIRNI